MNGITVGIPAYNARKTLEFALDSALSQTIKAVPFEIIVIDDGSTDTTANIALSYELMFPDVVRLIRTENRGVAAARNRIIEEARYDHLTWLDADDFYHPTKLEAQYDALMVQHMFHRTIPGEPYVMAFYPFLMDRSTYTFARYFDEPIKYILAGEMRAYLWASMVATDAYRTVGPFNESLHRSEDTDWLLRYLQASPRLLVQAGSDSLMTYHFSTQRDGKLVEDSFTFMVETYGGIMRANGIFDEYVPRRYWEISGFYHANKKWSEMWRCRAMAAKLDPARFGAKLEDEISSLKDDAHRNGIRDKVRMYQN